jgi:hypothetical protein
MGVFMNDVILIFEDVVKCLYQLPKTEIDEILKNSQPSARPGANKRDIQLLAGLIYYYGIQVTQNINLAENLLLKSVKLNKAESITFKNLKIKIEIFITTLEKSNNNLYLKLKYFLKWPRNSIDRIEHVLDFFAEKINPSLNVSQKAAIMPLYDTLMLNAPLRRFGKAALSCLYLSNGTVNDKVKASKLLYFLSSYSLNINITYLSIAELLIYNFRTISIKASCEYIEHLKITFPQYFARLSRIGDSLKVDLRFLERSTLSERFFIPAKITETLATKTIIKALPPKVNAGLSARTATLKTEPDNGDVKPFEQISQDALEWLEKAAQSKEIQAIFMRGIVAQLKNETKDAFRLYRRATKASTFIEFEDLGFAEAFRAVSLCYLRGIGTKASADKALEQMCLYIICMTVGNTKGFDKTCKRFRPDPEGIKDLYRTYKYEAEPLRGKSFLDFINEIDPLEELPFRIETKNNLKALAYLLLFREHYADYMGLSGERPRALKIEPANFEQLDSASKAIVGLRFLDEARKLGNAEAVELFKDHPIYEDALNTKKLLSTLPARNNI